MRSGMMQFGGGRASLSRSAPATPPHAGDTNNPPKWLHFTSGKERILRSALGWSLSFGTLAITLVIPLVTGPYVTTFVFTLITALVLAQSWDWVGGQLGSINLGHLAFYG